MTLALSVVYTSVQVTGKNKSSETVNLGCVDCGRDL